jgi:hypothetical protein
MGFVVLKDITKTTLPQSYENIHIFRPSVVPSNGKHPLALIIEPNIPNDVPLVNGPSQVFFQILPAQTRISFPISTPSIIEFPALPVNPILEVAQASSLVNNALPAHAGSQTGLKGRKYLAGRRKPPVPDPPTHSLSPERAAEFQDPLTRSHGDRRVNSYIFICSLCEPEFLSCISCPSLLDNFLGIHCENPNSNPVHPENPVNPVKQYPFSPWRLCVRFKFNFPFAVCPLPSILFPLSDYGYREQRELALISDPPGPILPPNTRQPNMTIKKVRKSTQPLVTYRKIRTYEKRGSPRIGKRL